MTATRRMGRDDAVIRLGSETPVATGTSFQITVHMKVRST
jgi:hypothetical protein